MKQLILALAAILASQTLLAQDVTYVLFNRDCMNQLEYRFSYPNLRGENAVWAYSIKPNVQEHYIFMTQGAGHYSPELPAGTLTCSRLNLDDAFVARINRDAQQMLIVFQRQSGGYWLMPVESATLVARSGSRYWVRASQSSFQFDTLNMVNEQNLAVIGSPTAAYFSGAKVNNCLMEYSFHCEPVKAGQTRSDFQFIPSIGIVNDRTGNSASQAMENELQLVKVNGLPLNDYISDACPEGSAKIAISKFQKPANYGDKTFEPDKEIASIMQKEQDGEKPAEHSGISEIQCADDWEPGTHIVQKGENLRAIARTYKVSEQNLVKWNKIQNPDVIEICQKIWLKKPPAAATANTKGVAKPLVYDAQPDSGKKVKMQGGEQISQPSTKGLASKSMDPNRPIVYSNETTPRGIYQYSDPARATAQAKIHTVHRGEYLYKIAKMYGCPEECIRVANNMPLEGDEPLRIGQQLIIPECTCMVNGQIISPALYSNTNQAKPIEKPTPNTTAKAYSATQRPRGSILDEAETTPQVYGPPIEEPVKDPNRFEENSLYGDDRYTSSGNKTNTANKKKTNSDTPKVPLFKEHHVKQGENIKSIAAKYRVDAFELSQVNGLDPKEALTPGKLVLIPIEDEN